MSDLYYFSLNKFKIAFPGTNGVVYDHPIARSGHRVIIDGYNLYSFGGFHPTIDEEYNDPVWALNRPQFSEVWKYNILSRHWTRLPTTCKHPGLASPCLIKHSRLAILFGGTIKEFFESANNQLTIYNLDTNIWTEHIEVSGAIPRELYGQGITMDGNLIYIVGGTQGYEYSIDVHVFNILEKRWTYLQPDNISGIDIADRYRHEIVKHGNRIYVIGGGTSNLAFSLEKIPTLNLDTVTWTITNTIQDPSCEKFPNSRKCHVVIKYKKYIYVHGGQSNLNERSGVQESCDDFWRLSLDTLQWQLIPSTSSQNLFFHSADVTEDGCIYMFGGSTENSLRTNQIECIWIDVPTLKTMAMEALSHYVPNLPKTRAIDLLKMGIPRDYVKELRPSEFQ